MEVDSCGILESLGSILTEVITYTFIYRLNASCKPTPLEGCSDRCGVQIPPPAFTYRKWKKTPKINILSRVVENDCNVETSTTSTSVNATDHVSMTENETNVQASSTEEQQKRKKKNNVKRKDIEDDGRGPPEVFAGTDGYAVNTES